MRVVIQRTNFPAKVIVNSEEVGSITRGLVILLGIHIEDEQEDIDWLVRKIIQLRIFNDDQHKMNLSLQDIQGEILVVSQFTLFASTRKGNRPSFIKSAKPEKGEQMYEKFTQAIRDREIKVSTGVFGADMKLDFINDGPVTIIMDSKNRE